MSSREAPARVQTAAALAMVALCACAGNAGDARYPTRHEGCEVTLFHESPPMPTDNIGPVEASCSDDVPDADCLRTLKDAVCKLGGDVVWGVAEAPKKVGDKNHWAGRAAHTRIARSADRPAT